MTNDDLYRRAMRICDGQANGQWLPIMKHLAMRRYTAAMVVLANWYDDAGVFVAPTSSLSSDCLLRRAWKMGEVTAAQSKAMERFNANDLAGFRLWARRAAKLGDAPSADHIKRFETRLPHGDARKIGRHRPETKRDLELFLGP